MRLPLVFALALAWLAPLERSGIRPPDEVELSSGRTLHGRVLFEDARVVLVRDGERLRELERREVRRLLTLEDRVGELLDRLESLDEDELDEQVELAERARALGLQGEAQILLLRVVLRDASHARARELLGHVRVGSAWQVSFEGERLPLTALARRRMSWRDAWTFETAHYSLRTNLDLPQALEAALDLEIAHRAFYELLGDALGLRRLEDRLTVEIHTDPAHLPGFHESLQGWFDAPTNRLILDASAKLDRALLFHEATHQLLFNTLPALRQGVSALPSWLDEGLAEFVQCGLSQRVEGFRQAPGRSFDFEWLTVWQPHVELLARRPEPPSLEETLALGPHDFAGGRDFRAAYAQAYGLVDFLMNADGGRRQEALFDLLRSAGVAPLGSELALTRLAGGDVLRFDLDWLAYVQELAVPKPPAERRRGRR